jgi:hypothetical protein
LLTLRLRRRARERRELLLEETVVAVVVVVVLVAVVVGWVAVGGVAAIGAATPGRDNAAPEPAWLRGWGTTCSGNGTAETASTAIAPVVLIPNQ